MNVSDDTSNPTSPALTPVRPAIRFPSGDGIATTCVARPHARYLFLTSSVFITVTGNQLLSYVFCLSVKSNLSLLWLTLSSGLQNSDWTTNYEIFVSFQNIQCLTPPWWPSVWTRLSTFPDCWDADLGTGACSGQGRVCDSEHQVSLPLCPRERLRHRPGPGVRMAWKLTAADPWWQQGTSEERAFPFTGKTNQNKNTTRTVHLCCPGLKT